jgi:hypothetical protein
MSYQEELKKQEAFKDLDGEDEEKQATYSLLVSNVGWVYQDNPDREEVEKDYNEYVASTCYSQVSMWASDQDDPIKMVEIEKEYPEGYPEKG